MELKEVRRHWDAFGKMDPLWAILAQPNKRHGRWKYGEFFACGEEEVDRILRHADTLTFPLCHARALDFGCGAGRLTLALARHFQQCDGVDIAPSMIALARKYDQPWRRFCYEAARPWRTALPGGHRWADCWPGLSRLLKGQRCRFLVNDANDLTLFRDDTFDLIYSSLVLQHMRPEYSLNYIAEFLRVLAPGGLIIFQIPGRRMAERELPYRACIRVEPDSLAAKAGEAVALRVRVQNVSDFTWPAVNVGNHWLSDTGEMLVLDDARAPLPAAMKPQQEVQVSFRVTVPKRLGAYWLEFDVVQEFVLWFQTMGSQTTRIPCQVQASDRPLATLHHGLKDRLRAVPGYRASVQFGRGLLRGVRSIGAVQALANPHRASPGQADDSFEPIMETYGIPRDEMVKWIETHGGRVVDIQKDLSVGKDWESFRYFVTKP